MQHQIHYGRKFYLDKKTGYWISTDYPRIRAHVWVWINVNKDIKKGFHIHHLDGDKSNNSIDNLKEISAGDHTRLHCTEERKQMAREWCEIIRHLTKEWHSSEEGHKWHVEHGKRCWENKKVITINCLMCFKEVETKTYHQKFCHQNCKAKYGRRANKYKRDNILKSEKH